MTAEGVELKDGDLVLSCEDTFFSWLVRKITRSAWSHVGLYKSDGGYLSAVPFKGVCVKPLWGVKNFQVYRVKGLTDEQRAKVIDFCMQQLGKPYDFIQGLLLGWRILTDTLATHGDDPYAGRYICSELVAEAYASVGVQFSRLVDNVLPGTIAKSPLTTRIR